MNAPCGHPGIPIIGTYVKCAVGCDGPVPPPRRGEPGHVEMCACRPCQIRRRVVVIELRSRDGQSIRRLPWDGVSDKVGFTAAEYAEVRHTLWLDAEGKVIVRHDCWETIREGDRVDLTLHPDRAAAEATLLRVWGESPVQRLARQINPGGLTVAELIEKLQLRIAASIGIPEFILLGGSGCGGYPAHDMELWYRGCTRSQLYAMALTVPGVRAVEVKEPQPGDVRIIITEGDDEVDWRWERVVRAAIEPCRPAGVAVDVFVETPQEKLRRVARAVERAVATRVPARDYDALAVDLAHEMLCEQFGECVAQEATVNVRVLFGGSRLHITVPTRGRFYCIMVPLPEFERLIRFDSLMLTAGVVTPEEVAASRWSAQPATTEHPPKK